MSNDFKSETQILTERVKIGEEAKTALKIIGNYILNKEQSTYEMFCNVSFDDPKKVQILQDLHYTIGLVRNFGVELREAVLLGEEASIELKQPDEEEET